MAARFAEHPEAVAETARLAERLRFDLTSRARLPLSRLRGPRRRPHAGRDLPRPARAALRGHARAARGRAAARGGAAGDPRARALGLLPPALRPARARARGRGRGPRPRLGAQPAAAGARAGLERQLGGLLPDRALARRPGAGGALPRALPQRRDHRDARHRPRLPARHPRAADPARPRALRARARGAGLGLRLLPLARRGARPRQGARAAAGRDRAGRRGRRRVRARRRRSSATSPRRSGRRGRRSPRWRWLARLAREAWGLPRHLSQHPGGMVLSTRPLVDICPVQPAAMEGRQIVQWDKDSCADAGFLKIDLLGLGMLSAVERCVEEIAAARDERIDLSRIPLDDEPDLRGDPGGRDDRRVPDREPRADADAAAQPAGDARRRDRPGGAGAPGADPGRRRASLPRAAQAAARGPRLRGALRAPEPRADPRRHARRDRLPGPGDPGGDGDGGLHRRRGRGAAAGDEPQALGGGAERLRRALRRRRGRARRRARARRAGVRAGARLLGLRLSEVARGRLRPARLPVDLAARPLRPRAALRAVQRAADGLLSARLAHPRGAAARDRGARAWT